MHNHRTIFIHQKSPESSEFWLRTSNSLIRCSLPKALKDTAANLPQYWTLEANAPFKAQWFEDKLCVRVLEIQSLNGLQWSWTEDSPNFRVLLRNDSMRMGSECHRLIAHWTSLVAGQIAAIMEADKRRRHELKRMRHAPIKQETSFPKKEAMTKRK